MNKELVPQAVKFCVAVHGAVDQRRKYDNVPYYVHPIKVASVLADFFRKADEDMLAAAYLHDVVEDTDVTLEQVKDLFGERVAMFVYWLTDVSKPEDGNRAVRKELDRQHFAKAPYLAQVIKCADILDNTQDITRHDPSGFAPVYLNEVRLLLDVMCDETKDTTIWKTASGLVDIKLESIRLGHGLTGEEDENN